MSVLRGLTKLTLFLSENSFVLNVLDFMSVKDSNLQCLERIHIVLLLREIGTKLYIFPYFHFHYFLLSPHIENMTIIIILILKIFHKT